MPDKYISVEAFTASVQERYCKDCDRRKGMKNGKLKTVYAIGDAPCRSCGIDDMLDDIDAYPPADVVLRSCYDRILAENDTMREQLATIGKKPGDKMDDVRHIVPSEWERPEGVTSRSWVFRCKQCGNVAYWPIPKNQKAVCGYPLCPFCGATMKP